MEVQIYNQNRIKNSKDCIKATEREEVIGYSRGIVKENKDDQDDVNIEESSYKWLEAEKTESVKETNVDSPLDVVDLDNQIDCDSGQREYITEVLKCFSDIRKEKTDLEAADYLLLNSEDGIIRSHRKEVIKYSRGIGKQNIDNQEAVDIEEMDYKCLGLEKTVDVKEDAKADYPSDKVGFGEQMSCMLNTSWDEVDQDNGQSEYNMSEVSKFYNNIKKEKSDFEDMVIDVEKWVQDETTNSVLKLTGVTCEDNVEFYKTKLEDALNKQNISNRVAVDREEFSFKWLELEKTEDMNEDANADLPLNKVGCDSPYREQMICMLNTSWDEVDCDNGQSLYNISEVLKIDNNIKKDKTDPEVVIIDEEDFLQDGTENNEKEHNNVSKKGKLHQCQFCDYKCKYNYMLKRHHENKHSQTVDWHYCEYCEYKAKNRKRLMYHFKGKHDANAEPYKCCFCDYETKYKSTFLKHYKTRHDQDSEWHICQHCAFKTKHKRSLEAHSECKHIIVNEKDECYKCCFCNYETKYKSSFLKHYKTRHDQDSEWHHCQHCVFKTKHKRSLQAHLECKHNIVNEKGRLHQCQYCDYRCKFKYVLKRHLKTKHSQNKAKEKRSSISHFIIKDDANVKWHKCCLCGYKTKHKSSLDEHLEVIHDIVVAEEDKFHQFSDHKSK